MSGANELLFAVAEAHGVKVAQRAIADTKNAMELAVAACWLNAALRVLSKKEGLGQDFLDFVGRYEAQATKATEERTGL